MTGSATTQSDALLTGVEYLHVMDQESRDILD